MKKWITRIILHPAVLSLFVTLAIIAFLPPALDRYQFEEAAGGIRNYKNLQSHLFFLDVNNNGQAERIDTYFDGRPGPCIQIFSSDGGIFDQWNLRGSFIEAKPNAVAAGDVDGDGDPELFIFTMVGDSVFFSCIGELDGGFRIRERLICTISREYTSRVEFALTCEEFHDLNRDGVPEILGNNPAAGNIHDRLDIPFDDYHAWLMVLTDQLAPKFEPVGFRGFRNELKVIPFGVFSWGYYRGAAEPAGHGNECPFADHLFSRG